MIVNVQVPPRMPYGPFPAGRTCLRPNCGALLRTDDPGPICEPCRTPAEELREPDDPAIAELDRYRTERRLEELANDEGLAA